MAKFNGIYTPQAIELKAIDNQVDITDVKRNLRFDDPTEAHADDDQLTELIDAALQDAENYTGRVFAYSEGKFYAYNFSAPSLRINIAPYIAIKHLKVSTDNGATFTTLAEGDNYNVNRRTNHFEIIFESGQSTTFDEIEIAFYCGYKIGELPPRVKQYIIVEASDGYDTDRSKYNYQVSEGKLKERALGPFVITRF